MDVIKDFFAGLKDRLSSPFFISFLVSWSVCNYRITVPLLFYKHEDVKWDYKSSYLDLIQQLHDRDLIYLWTPLLLSLVFSGGYPVLKSGFEFFQEYIITHKDKFYYKHLAKVEAISVEKHRELSDQLKLDKAKYADEIRTRDARIADKERLEAEGQTLKERIAQMEDSQKLFADQLDAEHTSYMKAQERSEQLFTELALSYRMNDELKIKISNKEGEFTQLQNNHLHEINLFREEKNTALAAQALEHEERLRGLDAENASRLAELQEASDRQLDSVKKDFEERTVELQEILTKKETEILKLINDFDAEHFRFTELQSELARLTDDLTNKSQTIDQLNEQIQSFVADSLQKDQEISQNKQDYSFNLHETETRYKRQLIEKSSEANSLLENLVEVQAELDRWKAERNALLASKTELESQNEERLKVITNWYEELDKLSIDIGPLDASVVSREGQMATLPSAKLSKCTQYIDKVQRELPGVVTYHP